MALNGGPDSFPYQAPLEAKWGRSVPFVRRGAETYRDGLDEFYWSTGSRQSDAKAAAIGVIVTATTLSNPTRSRNPRRGLLLEASASSGVDTPTVEIHARNRNISYPPVQEDMGTYYDAVVLLAQTALDTLQNLWMQD